MKARVLRGRRVPFETMSIVVIILIVIAVASVILKAVFYNRGPKIVVRIPQSPLWRAIILVVALLVFAVITLTLPGVSR